MAEEENTIETQEVKQVEETKQDKQETPASSNLDKAPSPTFGISAEISSEPNLVSLEIQVNSSMCMVVKRSSSTTLSEIKIESSKL